MMRFFKFLHRHQLDDADTYDENGETALHLAVKNEKFTQQEIIAVLENLLDLGIDVNIKNKKRETILHLAITSRMKDVISFLISRKVKLNYLVADYVIRDEYKKFVELKYQLSMSNSEMEKLESESVSFVEWLILMGLDIDGENCFQNSAVHSAIRFNLQHILPILLKYTNVIDHIDAEDVGGSLLHLFLWKNKSLRDYHEDKPSKVWYSSYTSRYAASIVRIMLDKGVSPEAVDVNGDSALHVAIEVKENVRIIKMLIQRSTDVDQKNFIEKTPFYVALWKWVLEWKAAETDYYLQILRALIDKGVNISKLDKYRYALLGNALEKNNLLLIDFLRENAIGEIRVGNYKTLIQLLVEKIQTKGIKQLLKYWIKLDVANFKPVPRSDYVVLTNVHEYRQYYKKCFGEVKTLKNTFIDSRMSLYKWLHRKPNSTCNMHNEQLQQLVHSPKLEEQFPVYAVLILASYESAKAQKSLLARAKNAWIDLTNIDLPDICIEAILSHLSTSELIDITEID